MDEAVMGSLGDNDTARTSPLSSLVILVTNLYTCDVMPQKDLFEDWGFTPGAESLNGRLAMIAFVTAIAVELLTGQGFLSFLRLL